MIIDCHNHIGVEPHFFAEGFYPYAQDVETLVRTGSALGVDRWIVFPFVAYRGLELDGKIIWPPDGPDAPYAFENRRHLVEMNLLFPEEGSKCIHFVMLDPARRQVEQVAALRRLREEFPFHGLKIQATVIRSPIRELLGAGSCLLDLAEEWNLPLLIHSSIKPDDSWSQAGDILDVVESRPGIRFCLAHSCRFDKPSLDRLANLPNAWFDCSAHVIHCILAQSGSDSVAALENRFPTDYRSPEKVLGDLAAAYPEKLMWGSDSPFQSWITTEKGALPRLFCTYEREVEVLRAQDAAVINRIANENILAFLGPELRQSHFTL